MSENGSQAESSAAQLLKDRRFKLSRACDRCRRRRIRCDEGHPCKSCTNASSECTFEEIGKKTVPHKSRRSTLEDRMQQLESLIQALPSGLFNTGLPSDSDNPPATSIGLPPPRGPPGVLPPSLTTRNLINPAKHFPPVSPLSTQRSDFNSSSPNISGDVQSLPLSSSYLYLDDQGSTRWQGEMSGFPLLDLLLEREAVGASSKRSESPESSVHGKPSPPGASGPTADDDGSGITASESWFPDRKPTKPLVKPEAIWKLVISGVEPDLMDSLVRCFLSTTYYLMPFIHVPTFLSDYGDPDKWDTGFASFVIAICCLTSRHVDDIRVRADPGDAFSSGSHWFELLTRLRTLPGADRPTLYTVQAVLIAAVYAIGLGKLSKGLALLSEAVTLCIDAGLHRSVAAYDHFDPIETEVRKRTFWSVYAWDKQAAAYFGRPPMIRLRDCDVPEPEQVDDDYITKDGIGQQPHGTTSLMSAFVNTNRLYIIIEGVLDVHPVSNFDSQPTSFLAKASSILSGFRQSQDLREAEGLLDGWCHTLPPYWAVTADTMTSKDVVRITQAERLHCLEHFIRMLIYRYRFAVYMANPTAGAEETKEIAMRMAQRSALQIIAKHLEISSLGLMTYYGLFVIHQLTQAGRSLIAVLLECKNDGPLISSSLEALKACIGLLRRFSGRYVCGLRSADLLEEICRLSQIPLEILEQQAFTSMRPAWLRPVRKRLSSKAGGSDFGSPPPSATLDNNVIMQDAYAPHVSQSQPSSSPDGLIGGLPPLIPHSFDPRFLSSQGGLMEPLMAGQVEPLSADMFAHEEISGFSANDLLALFAGGASSNPMNFSSSLLEQPMPLGFGMGGNGMTVTMGLDGRLAASSVSTPGG